MLFRLILLLAIVGGLTVFALSNGSTLALTFLGMQTPTLPLALWVLGAIAAGAMTHLLITALFRLSNLLAVAEVRSQLRRERRREGNPLRPGQRPLNDDSDWQNWDGYEPREDRLGDDRQPPSPKTSTKAQAPIDDWEDGFKDDWEDEPRPQPRSTPEPRPTSPSSGPAYSAPSPRQSVGRTETRSSDGSVVDANFRVLVPPTRSTPQPTSQPNSADDWFEDDDLETDEERRRRLGL